MTDFLKRIAQRALSVAAVVQPIMGSRYAPTPDLSVPATTPGEDRPSENATERTPDLESLSADGSFLSTARQIMRRAPSVDAVETTAGPFAASASPTQTHLKIQSLIASEEESFTTPAENNQTRARLLGEGLEQSSTLIIGEPSARRAEVETPTAQIDNVRGAPQYANGAVNSEAIAPRDSFDLGEAALQRAETENASVLSPSRPEPTIGAKPATHHARNPVDSPAIAPHGQEGFAANDSRPPTHEHRSAPLTAPFSSEAIDREGFPEKRLAQDRLSDRYSTPSRGDASLINQSLARGADQQLLSSKDVGDVHAAPEKIIRVTIGRIEVRAVTPPPQPVESPAPPAPKLSLDEFLRQPNGGRR